MGHELEGEGMTWHGMRDDAATPAHQVGDDGATEGVILASFQATKGRADTRLQRCERRWIFVVGGASRQVGLDLRR